METNFEGKNTIIQAEIKEPEEGAPGKTEEKEIVWDHAGDMAKADRYLNYKIEQRKLEEERKKENLEKIEAMREEEKQARKENSLLSKVRRSLGI